MKDLLTESAEVKMQYCAQEGQFFPDDQFTWRGGVRYHRSHPAEPDTGELPEPHYKPEMKLADEEHRPHESA